ncbi:hypothetical protein DID88_006341 [Monilinia fructigena]|uniref:Uncharacterized protein n=1 Tax=Monilinia fructigena TaxID=38457 RepID=A0A395J332_9HELO|nr:hypothetical protein DID88_006341 [Monilinia fructigena]
MSFENLLPPTLTSPPRLKLRLVNLPQLIHACRLPCHNALRELRSRANKLLRTMAYVAVLASTLIMPMRGSLGPPSWTPSPRSPSQALSVGL